MMGTFILMLLACLLALGIQSWWKDLRQKARLPNRDARIKQLQNATNPELIKNTIDLLNKEFPEDPVARQAIASKLFTPVQTRPRPTT